MTQDVPLNVLEDEKELPLTIQKRLSGMRGRIERLRATAKRQPGPRSLRRMLKELPLYDPYIRAEQLVRKLDNVTWTVVFDSPKTTAEEIKLYLRKVRAALALDEE